MATIHKNEFDLNDMFLEKAIGQLFTSYKDCDF